jgi:hypothetical protein
VTDSGEHTVCTVFTDSVDVSQSLVRTLPTRSEGRDHSSVRYRLHGGSFRPLCGWFLRRIAPGPWLRSSA